MGMKENERGSKGIRYLKNVREQTMHALLGDDFRTPVCVVPLHLDQVLPQWKDRRSYFLTGSIWDITAVKVFPEQGQVKPDRHILYTVRGFLDLDKDNILRFKKSSQANEKCVNFGRIDDEKTLQTVKNIEGFDVAIAMRIDAQNGADEYVGSLHPDILVRPALEQLRSQFAKLSASGDLTGEAQAKISATLDMLVDRPGLTGEQIVYIIELFKQLRENSSR